ncbi:MAG: HlyC/CorC family transporter [Chitinophagaceae bacterium]|nr:HlyC/CorC family transporter [Oligoflexus sp.]
MSDLLPFIVIVILVLINGLFVAAEFALIGTPRTQIDQAANQGNAVAKVIQSILKNPNKQAEYIATAQLGITLASLGLGMYGERKIAELLFASFQNFGGEDAVHTVASILALGILTFLHIVLGEMVPKSMALQKPQETSLWITPIVVLVQKCVFPLIIALNKLGNGFLKLIGVTSGGVHKASAHTAEELEFVFKESQEGGQLRKKTREILQDLLYFGHLNAGEVMVPRIKIIGIPIKANNDEVKAIISKSKHTRYPLYDGSFDNIVGTVHTKDFLRAQLKGEVGTISDLIRPVPYVPEAASLEQVLKIMRKHNAHMVVVIDEFGGTAGLLSIEDLFEEVVGEIGEGGGESPDIQKDKNSGVFRVTGMVRIEDLGVRLHQDMEHEDVDTVNGLIMTLLGRLPKLGDGVVYKGYRFEVIEIDGHGVGYCNVSAVDPLELEKDKDKDKASR